MIYISESKERCIILGEYMITYHATVRATARKFGVSKSTVHKDVTIILKSVNEFIAKASTDITSCISHNRPVCQVLLCHHHHPQRKQEETEAQRNESPCPQSKSPKGSPLEARSHITLPPTHAKKTYFLALSPLDHHRLCICLIPCPSF